jgi:hypothetical protein
LRGPHLIFLRPAPRNGASVISPRAEKRLDHEKHKDFPNVRTRQWALLLLQISPIMVTGETFQERSKGKDVRSSNILAAKVRRKRQSN